MPFTLSLKHNPKIYLITAATLTTPFLVKKLTVARRKDPRKSYKDTLKSIRDLRKSQIATPQFVRAVKDLEIRTLNHRSTPFNL